MTLGYLTEDGITKLVNTIIYGSSRIGVHQTNTLLRSRFANVEISITLEDVEYTSLYRGKRNYELSNHLGNVQVVVSDKRISVCDSELEVEYFKAEVLSAVDYFPFGAPLDDRQWYASNDSSGYRYGFNGMERDNQISGQGNNLDFGARIYDSRLGRWLSMDPLSVKYPALNPFNFVANMPIIAVDPDGRDIVIVGSPEYRVKVYSALLKLSQTELGEKMINDILNSKKTIVIGDFEGYNESEYLNGQDESKTIDGSEHTYINFDAKDETFFQGKDGVEIDMPAWIILGHELTHFYEYMNGVRHGGTLWQEGLTAYNKDEDGDYRPIWRGSASEVHAVHYENILRAQAGLPLRYYYGTGMANDPNKILIIGSSYTKKGYQFVVPNNDNIDQYSSVFANKKPSGNGLNIWHSPGISNYEFGSSALRYETKRIKYSQDGKSEAVRHSKRNQESTTEAKDSVYDYVPK